MCGIFCGKNQILHELYQLNSYRGNYSYSVFNQLSGIKKGLGKPDSELFDTGYYSVCHVQAPTTEISNSTSNIHPAVYNGMFLWHNGIIKDFEVARLQTKYNTTETWDTALLLRELDSNDFLENLSDLNGSFACILVDGSDYFVFRNEISPLFYDSNLNISSVKFPNSIPVPANNFFMLDFELLELVDLDMKFETKENPYFFD